jgi:hypothetical protein
MNVRLGVAGGTAPKAYACSFRSLAKARASALVSIRPRRAEAEPTSLPGIRVGRETACTGIADVKVTRFDH